MIEFANPWLLLLAPAVPLLVRRWLRRPGPALPYSSAGLLRDLPAGRGRVARWGGALFRTAGLLLLVAALAGPRWPDPRSRISTQGVAIQMVVDVSGSMAEPDFPWEETTVTRLDAARKVFHLFVAGGDGPGGVHLDGRPDDLIGLVAFATWPESPCPLTLSHSVLLGMLDDLRPRTVPTEAHTNIGDALAWALHRFANTPATRKVILLLSDGEHNVPPPALTPRQAAQLAANLGVRVYAIDAAGEATPTEGPDSSSPEARARARESMQEVARLTGGKWFRAPDAETLLQVCGEIDRLERAELPSFLYRRYFEGYPWVGLASFVCWIAVFLLERTAWLRIP